jgi:hypothetical protein
MRWCLSPLQADRKRLDEKLWNGKNETKWFLRKFADGGKKPSNWRRADVLRKPSCLFGFICSIA